MTDKNKWLEPIDAPISKPRQEGGFAFETQTEIQVKKVRASKMTMISQNVNSVRTNGTASGTALGFTHGDTVYLTSTLTQKAPNEGKPIFGIFYGAMYEGTSRNSDYQIWPVIGGSIGHDDYKTSAGYNIHSWDGINCVHVISITYLGAGTPDLAYATQWKYLDTTTKGST